MQEPEATTDPFPLRLRPAEMTIDNRSSHSYGALCMTERTIYLDPQARPFESRKINVRAYRWYAEVELDRDDYVDATTTRGQEPELPTAYKEALDSVRLASTDRIWYDGYPGGFSWGEGARWITLPRESRGMRSPRPFSNPLSEARSAVDKRSADRTSRG